MAAFDTARTNYDAERLFGRIGAALCNIIGTFAAWNDARVTRNALAALTDRELEDIGLVRGDIDLVAERKRRF